MTALPPLPCDPDDLPDGLAGDITRCKVCGRVLRARDPATGQYAGAATWGVRVPDDRLHPDVPRMPAGLTPEQRSAWRYDHLVAAGVLWALCPDDLARLHG